MWMMSAAWRLLDHRGCIRREGGGGGGGWAPRNVYTKKWPDQIFPMVNFVFSHCGHFGTGGGGVPPLLLGCTAILIFPC